MKNLKQTLIDETKERIEEVERKIEESDNEVELLEAKLKVEKKMLEMRDLPEEIAEDVKYSAQALESMLQMEKNSNAEFKKEFEILRYRSQVVRKFDDMELLN